MTGGARLCAPTHQAAPLPGPPQPLREHRGQGISVHVQANHGVGFGRVPVGCRLAFGEFAVGFDFHIGGTGSDRPWLMAQPMAGVSLV